MAERTHDQLPSLREEIEHLEGDDREIIHSTLVDDILNQVADGKLSVSDGLVELEGLMRFDPKMDIAAHETALLRYQVGTRVRYWQHVGAPSIDGHIAEEPRLVIKTRAEDEVELQASLAIASDGVVDMGMFRFRQDEAGNLTLENIDLK